MVVAVGAGSPERTAPRPRGSGLGRVGEGCCPLRLRRRKARQFHQEHTGLLEHTSPQRAQPWAKSFPYPGRPRSAPQELGHFEFDFNLPRRARLKLAVGAVFCDAYKSSLRQTVPLANLPCTFGFGAGSRYIRTSCRTAPWYARFASSL